MRHRILDIAEQAAGLRVRHGALEIRLDQDSPCPALIPFDEIAVIIAAHRQIHCTRSVLSELSNAGGLFIVCDDKHLPVGMMLDDVPSSVESQVKGDGSRAWMYDPGWTVEPFYKEPSP